MKKKSIILCSLVVICAIGLVASIYIDWPVDFNKSDGDIAKAAKFSREEVSKDLSNMEELIKTDSAFKDDIVTAQVVMQTRAAQFATLVDMSNEVAGNIPAFAEVLKDMNAQRELVDNVASSLAESADNLNAALSGEECPDLAQSSINASLAYMTLQKQNNLANRFIETTDKYLETAQGDDKLKLVRDQWLDYQQMTAALEGDKASAEALAKKGNLLSGERALAAIANFGIAERLALLRSCELAQALKLPNTIGGKIRPKVLESEISSILLAQKEILAGRKINPHNAQKEVLAGRGPKIEPHNAQKEVLAGFRMKEVLAGRRINPHNALMIGNVISQTAAAANNSVMLNKKGPKIEP